MIIIVGGVDSKNIEQGWNGSKFNIIFFSTPLILSVEQNPVDNTCDTFLHFMGIILIWNSKVHTY